MGLDALDFQRAPYGAPKAGASFHWKSWVESVEFTPLCKGAGLFTHQLPSVITKGYSQGSLIPSLNEHCLPCVWPWRAPADRESPQAMRPVCWRVVVRQMYPEMGSVRTYGCVRTKIMCCIWPGPITHP